MKQQKVLFASVSVCCGVAWSREKCGMFTQKKRIPLVVLMMFIDVFR